MTVRSTPDRSSETHRTAGALAPITLAATLACLYGDPAWSAQAIAPARVTVDSACAARGIVSTGLADTAGGFVDTRRRANGVINAGLFISGTVAEIWVDTLRDSTGRPMLRLTAGRFGSPPRRIRAAFDTTVRSILAACGDTAHADVTYRSE